MQPCPPCLPGPAVYKAQCRRTGTELVLKCYPLEAICALYQHQVMELGALAL